MNDEKKGNLEEFMSESYPPLKKKNEPVPQLVKEQSQYKAFEEFKGRKSARFRIVDSDGKSYGCSYAHLIDWVFAPPTLLTLTTASRIFNFEGKNLGRIEQLLMEDKIRELHVFNESKFKPPANNIPIIEKLVILEE